MLSNSQTAAFRPADVWISWALLKNLTLRTPVLFSSALSRRTGCQIHLKMACWQLCGCFKVCGAINMVSALKRRFVARRTGSV
jgi:threonine dehydratase